jgi:protein TonB
MKFAACFILSAALHAAVLALPASQTEAERQQTFPVTIMVLSEPKPARASEPKRRLQNIPTTRSQAAPQIETIEDVKPKAVQEEAAAAPREEARAAAAPIQSASALEAPQADEKHEAKEPAHLIAIEAKTASQVSLAAKGRGNPIPERAREPELPEKVKAGGIGKDPQTAVFLRARYAHNPPPEYPENARRDGSQGIVVLSVLVDAEGRAGKVEISRSSGIQSLDEAAANSVRDWRFHPAHRSGRPVQSRVKIPIVFQLAGR